ncbi:hypothetical protein B0T16DRAFT_327201 [Cercophora newfieldiana]|uniref:Rhodopsin domain-containing protein n=1 Tax=Cercophora newfieldiana TaxID=92897 RepID=A0AA40CTI6_9PEZI|nr:hypothetical protein B0T16DRAFT_327201 [Cercophora newfieldiana]
MILPRNSRSEPSTDNSSRDSYGPRILAVCWLVEMLSGILIGLRVYCKRKRSRALWHDDRILMSAWLFQTANIVITTVNVSLGGGQHIYHLDPAVIPILRLTGNVSGTMSIIAASLSKTSFGFTLIRLTNGTLKWFIYALLVTMNIFLALSAIFIWARCTPVVKTWHHGMDGTCWDPLVNTNYGLFSGVYSAFVDFALSFLPWPLIWNLQMRLREKIGVAVAMSMGVFAGLGAIAKVLQLHNLSNMDSTYYKSEIVIWGTVETAVTIMAASIPFLRILVVESRHPRERRPYTARFMSSRPIRKNRDFVMKEEDWEQFPEIARPATAVC